jgi:hypothetical protein
MFKNGTTHKTTKGYLRITAGPCRHAYVHRIVAAAMLGRELTKDEEVHHRKNKLDPRHTNLMILGEHDHGWVSAKQSYFMTHIKEKADKKEWDEFMDEQAEKQAAEIARAKNDGVSAVIRDGVLQEAWATRGA